MGSVVVNADLHLTHFDGNRRGHAGVSASVGGLATPESCGVLYAPAEYLKPAHWLGAVAPNLTAEAEIELLVQDHEWLV